MKNNRNNQSGSGNNINNSKKNPTWAIDFGDEPDLLANPPGYINFNLVNIMR